MTYTLVGNAGEVADLVKRIRSRGLRVRGYGDHQPGGHQAKLVGISLSWKAGEAFYLPLAHRRSGELALDDEGAGAPANLPALTARLP